MCVNVICCVFDSMMYFNVFHPQSDPFVEIAKAQEGGVFTVVYRSQPIMKTLNPRCASVSM